MNGYPNYSFTEKQKYKIPVWVIILIAVALVFSVFGGYYAGINYAVAVKHVMMPDGNGREDTSLASLDFKGFICKFDDGSYNEFDSVEFFSLTYDSDAKYAPGGYYSNDYTGEVGADIDVSFMYLSYYDICYVNKNVGEKQVLEYEIEIDVIMGNMEAAVIAVSADYKCTANENGYSIVDDQYVTVIDRLKAGDSGTKSIPLTEGYIYMVVFAGENATGAYSLDVNLR